MRLVGLALLAAWWMAWAVSPHGEAARATSIVGAVAVAGGDHAAAAWLELRHGEKSGTLHVATVEDGGVVEERLRLPAGADATGFKLVGAGEGRFVLATEHHAPSVLLAGGGWLEFSRFGPDGDDTPPRIDGQLVGLGPDQPAPLLAWRLAAAGDELVAVESGGSASIVWVLGAEAKWRPTRTDQRVLVGAGGGHVVVYTERGDGGEVQVGPGRAGEWTAEVGPPPCFAGDDPEERAPMVTSVVGLPGGFARLARRGPVGCVDGIRDGATFAYQHVPLIGIGAARLAVADDGALYVHEEQEAAQLDQRRIVLPARPGGAFSLDARIVPAAEPFTGVRYRLFGGAGRLGVTTLAQRVVGGDTQVVLERGDAAPVSLAPERSFQPDYRPVLRPLAALPLALLLFSAVGAWRRHARVRRLAPLPAGVPLPTGRVAVEGELALDAEAPAGGLRVRRGRSLLTVFVEGAEVLRASDVRPRSQPRGDAVDVASGATVVAGGVVDPGVLYRREATLRARTGDFVLVGCTLAEARARIARRLASSAALLAAAIALIAAVAAR